MSDFGRALLAGLGAGLGSVADRIAQEKEDERLRQIEMDRAAREESQWNNRFKMQTDTQMKMADRSDARAEASDNRRFDRESAMQDKRDMSQEARDNRRFQLEQTALDNRMKWQARNSGGGGSRELGFAEYNQLSPEAKADYDRFKGRSQDGERGADWTVQQLANGDIIRANKKDGRAERVMVGGEAAQGKQAIEAMNAENKASGAMQSFDTVLNTLNTIKAHPGLDRSTGWIGKLPTAPGSDSADFEANLDTFKAQTFLPQVEKMKGAGALSDAEGKKLTDSVGALSTNVSPDAFRKNLQTIENDLIRARGFAEKKLGGINAITGGGAGQDRGVAPESAAPAPVQPNKPFPPGVDPNDPLVIEARRRGML